MKIQKFILFSNVFYQLKKSYLVLKNILVLKLPEIDQSKKFQRFINLLLVFLFWEFYDNN